MVGSTSVSSGVTDAVEIIFGVKALGSVVDISIGSVCILQLKSDNDKSLSRMTIFIVILFSRSRLTHDSTATRCLLPIPYTN